MELSLAQKIVREFASSWEGLLKLTRGPEALYGAHLESPARNFLELCEKLNASALNVECLQRSELRARLLRSFENSSGDYVSVLLRHPRRGHRGMQNAGVFPEYKTQVRDVTFLRKLKNSKESVEKVKNHEEDYATLRRLAAVHSFYRSKVIMRCSTKSPIEDVNIVASESKASSS